MTKTQIQFSGDIIPKSTLHASFLALGFHSGRPFGGIDGVKEHVAAYKKYNIPLDGVWLSIDLYKDGRTFTVDQKKYKDIYSYSKTLQSKGQYLVPIVPASMKIDTEDPHYNDAVEANYLIKSAETNEPLVGLGPDMTSKVVYLDFFQLSGFQSYWYGILMDFKAQTNFGGLGFVYNELSNFCPGECPATNETTSFLRRVTSSIPANAATFDPNAYKNLPYIPGNTALNFP